MKKYALLTVFVLATSISAKAELAPGYDSLAKFDAAIAAIANGNGKNGLATKNPGDVAVASAKIGKDKNSDTFIQVDVGNLKCLVRITTNPTPHGPIGAASYRGNVTRCQQYLTIAKVEVMKYDNARPTLFDAATKNNIDLSFQVVKTPQGPKVQLTGKK